MKNDCDDGYGKSSQAVCDILRDEKKTTKDWDGVFVLYKWFNTANTYLKTLTPRGIGGIVFFLFFFIDYTVDSTSISAFSFILFFSPIVQILQVAPSTCTRWAWSIVIILNLLCSFEEKNYVVIRDSCDNMYKTASYIHFACFVKLCEIKNCILYTFCLFS